MKLWKPIAPIALVICLVGCDQHSEKMTQYPNGQVRIDTDTNGVLTKTRLYDRDGQLISEGKPGSAE